MNRFGQGAISGAIGGLGATLLMSVIMLGARRLGLTEQLPPDRIAQRMIESSTDRPATHDETRAVASALHLGFGTGAGVAFGIMAAALPRAPGSLLGFIGVLYATGVWVVSYQGWVPGLHIMPPASRDDPGRVTTMVIAHWVYGITLGLATHRLRRWFSPELG